MSVKKEPHSGGQLSTEDALRFREVTREVMGKLDLTFDDFAEVIGCTTRTLHRYLSNEKPLYDSQVNRICEAFLTVVGDDDAKLHLLDELYRLHSPEMQQAFSLLAQWGEQELAKSPRERKQEGYQATRLALAKAIVNRLIRDGQVSSNRKREFQEAVYGIFQQAELKLERLTIRQLRTIREGDVVVKPEGFFFID